jgi:hypothetical protein
MRIVFLGRHQISSDARAGHALSGPQAAVDAFRASTRLIDWRIALAQTHPDARRRSVLRPLSAGAMRPSRAIPHSFSCAGADSAHSPICLPPVQRPLSSFRTAWCRLPRCRPHAPMTLAALCS